MTFCIICLGRSVHEAMPVVKIDVCWCAGHQGLSAVHGGGGTAGRGYGHHDHLAGHRPLLPRHQADGALRE